MTHCAFAMLRGSMTHTSRPCLSRQLLTPPQATGHQTTFPRPHSPQVDNHIVHEAGQLWVDRSDSLGGEEEGEAGS
jgi:hypothetical protein